MMFGCHCHMARAANRYAADPLSSLFEPGDSSSQVRLWYSMAASMLVVGFSSVPKPTPNPIVLRWRLSTSTVQSPSRWLTTPAVVVLSDPVDLFRRRPIDFVPNFLPHMMSKDSRVFTLGSIRLSGAELLPASPWPRLGCCS